MCVHGTCSDVPVWMCIWWIHKQARYCLELVCKWYIFKMAFTLCKVGCTHEVYNDKQGVMGNTEGV